MAEQLAPQRATQVARVWYPARNAKIAFLRNLASGGHALRHCIIIIKKSQAQKGAAKNNFK
jgi:hypothetical protein